MSALGMALAALILSQADSAQGTESILPPPLPVRAVSRAPLANGPSMPPASEPSARRPRTILPMQVPPPAHPPGRVPFQGAGTPATAYRPLPFYHLGAYVSPFRPRIFHRGERP